MKSGRKFNEESQIYKFNKFKVKATQIVADHYQEIFELCDFYSVINEPSVMYNEILPRIENVWKSISKLHTEMDNETIRSILVLALCNPDVCKQLQNVIPPQLKMYWNDGSLGRVDTDYINKTLVCIANYTSRATPAALFISLSAYPILAQLKFPGLSSSTPHHITFQKQDPNFKGWDVYTQEIIKCIQRVYLPGSQNELHL